jgi:hypothetical protein
MTTHVLAQHANSVPAVASIKGTTIITTDCLHDLLECGRRVLYVLPNPHKLLHTPAREIGGISGMSECIISVSGYVGRERSDLKGLIHMAGATFTAELSRGINTHLLCKYAEGKKWEKANQWGDIKIVSHRWISDCIQSWSRKNEVDYGEIVPQKKYFMLSNIRKSLKLALQDWIAKLGGVVIGDAHEYDARCTHVITSNLKATEKLLCASAAGACILRPDFITASQKAGHFVDESNYDWGQVKTSEWASRWRNIMPFAEVRAVVLNSPPLCHLIEAGGGHLLDFTEIHTLGAVDLVVGRFSDDRSKEASLRKAILNGCIPYVDPKYLVDYITEGTLPNMMDYVVELE